MIVKRGVLYKILQNLGRGIMHRIFCESYKNYIKSFEEDNYRLSISKPFELIVNQTKYEDEKKSESLIYKKLYDLISYMQENIETYPKFKAFLWTLEARNIHSRKYHEEKEEVLEEQAKLINSFLKLAYWY